MTIEERHTTRLRVSPLILLAGAAAYFTGQLPMLLLSLAAIIPHEVMHAVVAHYCGFQVNRLEVLPVGAVARIDGLFETHPAAETVIALVGPITNFILAAIAAFLLQIMPQWEQWLSLYIKINLAIALYNLLPALPLDGGRALRSLLSPILGIKRATLFCCWMGIYLGAAMTAAGIGIIISGRFNVFIIIFGAFLLISALQEKKRASFLFLMEITDKKDALIKSGALPIKQIAATLDTTLLTLVQRFRPRSYHMIIVVDNRMNPVGSVSEGEVVRAMMEWGTETMVARLVAPNLS